MKLLLPNLAHTRSHLADSLAIARTVLYQIFRDDRYALPRFCLGVLIGLITTVSVAFSTRAILLRPPHTDPQQLLQNLSCWASQIDTVNNWRPISAAAGTDIHWMESLGPLPESVAPVRTRFAEGQLFPLGNQTGQQAWLMILDLPSAPLLPARFPDTPDWSSGPCSVSLCYREGWVLVRIERQVAAEAGSSSPAGTIDQESPAS